MAGILANDSAVEDAQWLAWRVCPVELTPRVERTREERPAGASLAEIAGELGVSHQAASQVIQRAMAKCRRYLARRYPGLKLEDLLAGQ
jgi:hypothetical protein